MEGVNPREPTRWACVGKRIPVNLDRSRSSERPVCGERHCVN